MIQSYRNSLFQFNHLQKSEETIAPSNGILLYTSPEKNIKAMWFNRRFKKQLQLSCSPHEENCIIILD